MTDHQPCLLCQKAAHCYFRHDAVPTFFRCTHCGLLFADPAEFPDETELDLNLEAENLTQEDRAQFKRTFIEGINPSDDQGTMYPGNDYNQGDLEDTLFGRIKDALNTHFAMAHDTRFRCLEIGCATGFLLNQIQQSYPHAEASGIEPSPVSCAKAKQFYDLDLFQGTLNTFDVEGHKNQFDLIIIFGNLQLHSDPFASLRKCHQMLRPGGLLLFESKNPNAAARRLGRLVAKLPLLKNTRLGTEMAKSCFDGVRVAAGKQLLADTTATIGFDLLDVQTFPPRLLSVTNKQALSRGLKGWLWRFLDQLDQRKDERAWIQVTAARRR
jgi:2-polyprenyl-3-methyl-5-hydroxy-6-metoxy-1,4-benzoquinol methylase